MVSSAVSVIKTNLMSKIIQQVCNSIYNILQLVKCVFSPNLGGVNRTIGPQLAGMHVVVGDGENALLQRHFWLGQHYSTVGVFFGSLFWVLHLESET